jgi:penicillin V acylase-like amidase (Ntn superfamily)
MKLKNLISIFILMSLLWQTSLNACTAMSFQDANNKTWFLKSFDFDDYHGYVFVNQRNVLKKALSLNYFQHSKMWLSKYASITFNQISRDFPYGGINEKGLGMEILWLDDTVYPSWTFINTINESQVIQYILDTSASTEEVIANLNKVQLAEVYAPVHYMICDTSADCRAIEFLDGKLVSPKWKKKKRSSFKTPFTKKISQG